MTILPRRGVYVNVLTLQDIRDYYQVIGALENIALLSASKYLMTSDIKKMEKLNEEMRKAIEKNNFDLYYSKNLKFHNIYIDLSRNKVLKKIIDNLKKRLYDFPRQKGFVKEWELSSIREHQKIVEFLYEGKFEKAANFIRDVHWSFEVQEKFIRKYYKILEEKKIIVGIEQEDEKRAYFRY